MDREAQVMRRTALLDWDGTIREDFTIRAWVKFLVSHGVLPDTIVKDIEEVFSHLFKKSISHDDASRLTSEIYAHYLKGYSSAEITTFASLFMKEDMQRLCSFSSALFSCLTQGGIQAIISSGAPVEILQEYQHIFPIEKIFALELQTLNGIFVGNVLTNYGTTECKQHIITHLAKSYEFAFAAGNSSSDTPLLDAAPLNVIVNNDGLKTKAQSLHVSSGSQANGDGTDLE
jgi:phosphoserine phosphatase